jgi:hypothetical protein
MGRTVSRKKQQGLRALPTPNRQISWFGICIAKFQWTLGLLQDIAVAVETNELEAAKSAADQEGISRLLNLADKMIELSQQERKRLAADVEAAEVQEDLQQPL